MKKKGCLVTGLAIVGSIVAIGFGGRWFLETMKSIEKDVDWVRFVSDHPDACIEVGAERMEDCDPFGFECTFQSGMFLKHCLREVYVPEEYCENAPGFTDNPIFWAGEKCAASTTLFDSCADFVAEELVKMCTLAPLKYDKQKRRDIQRGPLKVSYEIADNVVFAKITAEIEQPQTTRIDLRIWAPDGKSVVTRCLTTEKGLIWNLQPGVSELECYGAPLTNKQARYARKVTAEIPEGR